MGTEASKRIFLFLFSLINVCSSGSRVECYHQKEVRRDDGEEKTIPSSPRQLLNIVRTTIRDSINPSPTLLPVTPAPQQLTTPPNNPMPAIVTVPSTFPGTITPTAPASNIPITTAPPTSGPSNQAPPITNTIPPPTVTIPGAQPVTNPVTTYPAPAGNVPVTTPVVPPAMINAPAIPGQSWCVAKAGASETTLQAALDYACGIGGVDCSLIQQGASCYNPNTMQNHASYAFNSYYQKNPQPTSCDFGGTANIVNTNPSTGTCIYPSSSSTSSPLSSSSTSPSTTSPSITSPSISTPATPASPLGSVPGSTGSDISPTVLNSSNPTSSGTTTVVGSDIPPGANTSTSMADGLQPLIRSIIIIATLMAGRNLVGL